MALYQLLVNNAVVLANSTPGVPSPHGVAMASFERNYNGPAKLTVRFNCDWRHPPFGAGAVVRLLRDDVEVFRGRFDMPRPIADVRAAPGVELVAYDLARQLNYGAVVDGEGNVSIRLREGALRDVVTAFMEHAAAEFDRVGVSTECEFIGGADSIQCAPVGLDNRPADQWMHAIAAAAPGVRCFLASPAEPGQLPRYAFVSLFGANAFDVSIDERFVPTLNIRESLDGRYGAVQTLEGATPGGAEVEFDQFEDLIPNWEDLSAGGIPLPGTPPYPYIPGWKYDDAYGRDADGNPTALAKVYREFKWTGGTLQPDMPLIGFARVIDDDVHPRWQHIEIESIDYDQKIVLLREPAIKMLGRFKGSKRMARDPGRAKPATAVKLRYTIAGTAGNVIYRPAVRHPATGFAGRAYELDPFTCGTVLQVPLPGFVSRETYAMDVHRAVSEPTVDGTLPLSEDLPAELWNLARRINIVSGSHGLTGYENLQAPLLGIVARFGGGNTCELQFSRDDSTLLREVPGG